MKLRHGFVSNSSSTSFCLVGYWLEEITPAQQRAFLSLCGKSTTGLDSDDEVDEMFHEECHVGEPAKLSTLSDDGGFYIGALLSYSNDDIAAEIDFEELAKAIPRIKEAGKIFDVGIAPQIFIGEVAS